MGGSYVSPRSSPVNERSLRSGPVLTLPTRSHRDLGRGSAPLRPPVLLLLRCQTLPPARPRSPATTPLSLLNQRGPPNPLLAERSPVPSSAAHSTPRYQIGRRVA